MKLRHLKANDWMLLRSIRLEALKESPYAFGSTYDKELGLLDEEWKALCKRWSTDQNTHFLLLYNRNDVVGMAGCFKKKEEVDTSVIYSFWINPAFRGTLISSEIIKNIEEWSAKQSVRQIEGYVTENNARARAFYKKQGFTETNERIKLNWDVSVDEILIQKRIGSEPGDSGQLRSLHSLRATS